MNELVDILRRHRTDLVDEVTAQIIAIQVPAPESAETKLRSNLEHWFDDLVELIDTGTSDALHDRVGGITSRSIRPFSQDTFRASYLIRPALQKVLDKEGVDFARVEPVLTRMMIAAGEAYSAAYQGRMLALQEQRLSREAEADRLRAVSHLVMGVAHELNTPLEVISQAAELMARDAEADIRDAAMLIRTNASRAARLIRQFRSLSVGEAPDAIQRVDVLGVVDDAIALYRTSILEPKLDIDVVDRLGNAESDRHWHGHRLFLTHALVNLLSNAEHHAYRDAGGPVDIVVARRDDRLIVTVIDRGVGIPEADLDNVLHPFFTTGRSRGRTGLGMAVVYNLVTSGMHGTLRIESETGEGTRVHLDLPWPRHPTAKAHLT